MIPDLTLKSLALTMVAGALALSSSLSIAASDRIHPAKQRVIDHWTPERMANAIPRDLVIDQQGQGFLRLPDGRLEPYGLSGMVPNGKPSGGDTTPPDISGMSPGNGATIGSSETFSAQITDGESGIKSVSFVITYPNGTTTQSFTPSFIGSDTWETSLQGFSDGNWSWQVVAKDKGDKGGNEATSQSNSFTVDTSGNGGTGGDTGGDTGSNGYIVTNSHWADGGDVQTAAGRIYFEMPSNPKWKRWAGYVCSGTVATDGVSGRSVIITAAHCVFDDANKAFARNVLFIPNQDQSSNGTDTNCGNDPLGCWAPSFGVVDLNWTNHTFPDNIEWDYAYYVISDTGAHQGNGSGGALDTAAGSLPVSFSTPAYDDGTPAANSTDFTHALGYSYSDDPFFMYCAEDMTTEGTVNWWLPNCGLSGGASGGPWIQPMDIATGSGQIISVNSWGYSTAPGMAGPQLDVTSAGCLFNEAKVATLTIEANPAGEQGLVVDSTACP